MIVQNYVSKGFAPRVWTVFSNLLEPQETHDTLDEVGPAEKLYPEPRVRKHVLLVPAYIGPNQMAAGQAPPGEILKTIETRPRPKT